MRILLDTADLEKIEYFNLHYPIEGVTTNPTILAKEGGDVVELLHKIRAIIGENKELHVQVTEKSFERIVREAEAIVAAFGKNTFVKIPATDVGLRATKYLSDKGIGVTVTAVLTAAQGMLASNSGASYVAPYISRSENLCADGVGTVADIAEIFSKSNTKTQILAASFKTAKEVLDVAVAGCHAATIGSTIMQMLITHTTTDTSIAGFDRDWREAFGEESLLERLEKKA
ncbi:MAG: fructose-6-phosphate aldolase [Clostridia bacterium]|nr:fructose-6-phosphate aldolase [Clostridia bacterium]MBP3583143.1 fructose-6-phosphate aldolase [Clostridia bacterium]